MITSRFLASKNNNATTSGKFLGWSFVGIKQIPLGIMESNPSAPDLENTSAPSAETVPDFYFTVQLLPAAPGNKLASPWFPIAS